MRWAASRAIRFDGTVVEDGLERTEITLSSVDMVRRKVRLLASHGHALDVSRELDAVIASGQLDPAVTEVDFDGIPDGLAALERGQVTGRLIARL